MNDPPRFVDGGGGELERELLASALRDVAPARAYRRVRAAIGTGVVLGIATRAGATGATATSMKTGVATPLLALKWAAVGAVAGTMVAGTATLVTAPARPRIETRTPRIDTRHVQSSARVRIEPPASPPRETADEPVLPGEPAGRVGSFGGGEAQSASRAPDSPLTPTRVPTPEHRDDTMPEGTTAAGQAAASAVASLTGANLPVPKTLAQEVALVDSARAALTRRDPSTALAAIARHDVEFGAGALSLDVAVLRVRALFMAGRRSEAEREIQRLLAVNPTGPYATRLRQLAAEMNP